jgi:pyruvyltransferase
MNKHYWEKNSNFGDLLNYDIIKFITEKEPVFTKRDDPTEKCFSIGSILVYANSYTHVWGSGLISDYDRSLPKAKPKKIYAVRGPMTRERLIEKLNVEVPEIYGDPAMLLPMFYNPRVEKKHKIGIIPHYIDKDNPWVSKYREKGYKVIDMRCTQGDTLSIIKKIKECDFIVSSSLHGLIIADAYGIKSKWIDFLDNNNNSKVFGGGFKFKDYFMSVNRPIDKPIIISSNSQPDVNKIYSDFADYEIDINLKKLYESCPYRK